jgi:ABC-2 type transport system ATP-binding protein
MELVLQHVSKRFDEKVILDNVDFTFEKGKIYGLLGRNGAGKTTLFNCISRNLTLDSGQILLSDNGEMTADFPDTDVGYVYATPHLPAFMTGAEFVKFFIELNRERITDVKTPEEYLEQIGIFKEDQHRLLRDYSHGMQNKVQMLVTLIVHPPVLLLDEPLTSFDVVAAHEMKELILKMKTDSVVVFSTHILQLAQDLSDEIVLLHNQTLRLVDANHIHDADFEEEVVSLLTTDEERQHEQNS